jgi:hypothetical protein
MKEAVTVVLGLFCVGIFLRSMLIARPKGRRLTALHEAQRVELAQRAASSDAGNGRSGGVSRPIWTASCLDTLRPIALSKA